MSEVAAFEKLEFPQLRAGMYGEVLEKGADFIKQHSQDSIIALQDRDGASVQGCFRPHVAFYAGERGAKNFQDWCSTHREWFGATDYGFRLVPIGEDHKRYYSMPYDSNRSD